MKMVHIVIFLRILQLPSCWFNTKHAMQHIYNSMYNTRCSTYILFLICQVYVFSMLELKKKNNLARTGADFPKDEAKRPKQPKKKTIVMTSFSGKWCLFQRCFLTSPTNLQEVTFNWKSLAQTKLFQERGSSCKSRNFHMCPKYGTASLNWV